MKALKTVLISIGKKIADIAKRYYKRYRSMHEAWQILILILLIFLLVFIMSFTLITAMSNADNTMTMMDFDVSTLEDANLYQINDYLFYDGDTHIVYYVIFSQDSVYGRSFGLMSPYYSSDGKLCRYVEGAILAIKN